MSIDVYPESQRTVGGGPVTLGYAQKTVDQPTISTRVDISGLSVTVTVPEGRRIRISAFSLLMRRTAVGWSRMFIQEGTAELSEYLSTDGIDNYITANASVVLTPTAGIHTYKVTVDSVSASTDLIASATYPAYLLVEDITGLPLSVAPASVPVGQLARAELSTPSPTAIASGGQDITNLSVNVVVPAGRVLKVSMFACLAMSTTGVSETRLLEDGVQVNRSHFNSLAANQIVTHCWSTHVSPAAGAHTYKAQTNLAAAGTLYADGANEAWLTVEDVTPTPAPANSAPSSTLGYAEIVADTATTTSSADAGLAVSVTVPAGRRLRISAHALLLGSVNGDGARLLIMEGATTLRLADTDIEGSKQEDVHTDVIVTPSAGAHTYKVVYSRWSGSGTVRILANPTYPAYILVEDVTGVGVPGHTHVELDDTGWLPITPLNGWIIYGDGFWALAAMLRRKAGVVYLRGLMGSAAATTGLAFTLPVGFRPAGINRMFTGYDSTPAAFRLDIGTDGGVNGPMAKTWVSFNLSFPVD